MPPDVGLVPWDTSCDLFAVGIVLYELITGQHPYPDRTPNAETPPTDPRQYVPNLAPALVNILLRAVSVDRNVRYHGARRYRQELLDLHGLYLQAEPTAWLPPDLKLAPDEVGRPDYNPYVTRFLTMYSQAWRDNSGTRGLDDVARLTYVETRLDQLLRPAVLDGTAW
jgi:serine/threonine protein kinase